MAARKDRQLNRSKEIRAFIGNESKGEGGGGGRWGEEEVESDG